MDLHSRPALTWRWFVFLIAGFYSAWEILDGNYHQYPFGPFRYMTIWALFLSFFCASRMLAISRRRSTRQWEPVVAATAVMNVMVVYLYWSLYLKDPALINENPPAWYRNDYLHLLGPLLQWIDVLFVWRGFRRMLPAAGTLLSVVVSYVFWMEVVLHPISARPVGTVTHGLPYPFLNNMTQPARLKYYATMTVVALVVMVVFRLASGLTRRVFGTRG